jgi:hypothetical protein
MDKQDLEHAKKTTKCANGTNKRTGKCLEDCKYDKKSKICVPAKEPTAAKIGKFMDGSRFLTFRSNKKPSFSFRIPINADTLYGQYKGAIRWSETTGRLHLCYGPYLKAEGAELSKNPLLALIVKEKLSRDLWGWYTNTGRNLQKRRIRESPDEMERMYAELYALPGASLQLSWQEIMYLDEKIQTEGDLLYQERGIGALTTIPQGCPGFLGTDAEGENDCGMDDDIFGDEDDDRYENDYDPRKSVRGKAPARRRGYDDDDDDDDTDDDDDDDDCFRRVGKKMIRPKKPRKLSPLMAKIRQSIDPADLKIPVFTKALQPTYERAREERARQFNRRCQRYKADMQSLQKSGSSKGTSREMQRINANMLKRLHDIAIPATEENLNQILDMYDGGAPPTEQLHDLINRIMYNDESEELRPAKPLESESMSSVFQIPPHEEGGVTHVGGKKSTFQHPDIKAPFIQAPREDYGTTDRAESSFLQASPKSDRLFSNSVGGYEQQAYRELNKLTGRHPNLTRDIEQAKKIMRQGRGENYRGESASVVKTVHEMFEEMSMAKNYAELSKSIPKMYKGLVEEKQQMRQSINRKNGETQKPEKVVNFILVSQKVKALRNFVDMIRGNRDSTFAPGVDSDDTSSVGTFNMDDDASNVSINLKSTKQEKYGNDSSSSDEE